MSDIVEFLRARLDEDEAVAREAIEIRQRVYRDQFESDTTFTAWDDHPAGTVVVGPERVLREVEAKRDLIAQAEECHAAADGDRDDRFQAGIAVGHTMALRALAYAYADHPDYRRDEWL